MVAILVLACAPRASAHELDAGLADAAVAAPAPLVSPPPPSPSPPPPSPPPAPPPATSGFAFGSYGRVSLATDLRGGTPDPLAVVAHAPRVVEASYVELELRHTLRAPAGWLAVTTITPAFLGEPFH